jgi:hypothetical protein
MLARGAVLLLSPNVYFIAAKASTTGRLVTAIGHWVLWRGQKTRGTRDAALRGYPVPRIPWLQLQGAAQRTDAMGQWRPDFAALGEVAMGPGCVKRAKTLDRDRTSHSFNAALGVHTASPFKLEIEFMNIILVQLRVFEFSQSLGQQQNQSAYF